ncbi:hypothetical protein [Streptomyces sp. NPDC058613]|uniref:hypothetical protein n=1 Tax=unclassified Streptomyces TaxID=2593676 RepID=UPI003649EF02
MPAPGAPVFARVDLALGGDGEPVVMELELIEPNLFLRYAPQGPRRFAEAVRAAASVGAAG